MSRTSHETLATAVTEELITYLGRGVINQQQLAGVFEYEDLDIDEFDRLKELHFVLHDDVVEYIEYLPERLRRLKTVSQQQRTVSRGEVRGAIDWNQTLNKRSQLGYQDPTLFVTKNPYTEYDIPENRVVKKLVSIISRILTAEIEGLERDWRAVWNDEGIVRLQRILSQNVYLTRLPDEADIELSRRDLDKTRRSRHTLYVESHRLYQLYRNLMDGRFEKEAVRSLLNESIVTPAETYTLFELFCIFRLIRTLYAFDEKLQLRPTDHKEIARLRTPDREVLVFYNSTGSFEFFEEFPTPDQLAGADVPQSLLRYAEAMSAYEDYVETFLDREIHQGFYGGRPDFLIEDWVLDPDKRRLRSILIGEVKYTGQQETFVTGLRELLEYLYFIRDKTQYLYSTPSSTVTGIICTDGIETDVDTDGDITHLVTSDLQTGTMTDRLQEYFRIGSKP